MTWAAVAIGGAGLISGLSGRKSGKKLQKEALALQREQLAFQKQRYENFQNQFGGVIQTVVDTAKNGVVADLGGVTDRASADVATSVAGQEAARLRSLSRMGVTPDSGRAEALGRQQAVSTALATAGNVTNARENERRSAEDKTWSRRWGVANLGVNQLNGANNDVMSASGSLSGSLSSMGNAAIEQGNQLISAGGSLLGGGLARNFSAPVPTGGQLVDNVGSVQIKPISPTSGLGMDDAIRSNVIMT